ncbi:MAG TPA: polysaccharide biosynthesis/export family protein [Aromatoleum sp.]|uniref:polysaccharide biosynthesis/export family protein n=1 Tax=Aromatoleum sp. TaxID=2307007 RepID=UPI002B460CCB|nr:polysaccharide biosynthesis/export family protein [Aromatoleum sp.]HJV25567.1 polysaccharide biosynthesis/export family protein [Aromatoleum sp.]
MSGLQSQRALLGARFAILAMVFALSGGCSVMSGPLPTSGPSKDQVADAAGVPTDYPIALVDISNEVARRLVASEKRQLFSETMAGTDLPTYTVGAGDFVEISIWEAPPATLFGSVQMETGASVTNHAATLPEQMVAANGTISVPFVGAIPVVGKSPQQIEAEITKRLKGKANQAQVMVRVVRNNTSNVTVVGEVANSVRMPLTASGERLLDALAAAGGVRQPVGKTTIQLTRGNSVQAMPLDRVIQDPRQNVILRPGDVVTAVHQTHSFTVLGATGKNEEVPFEAQGITLAQALGRAGGLQDERADAKGVFIFRFEDPSALGSAIQTPAATPDGKVPVVYRVDLKDPRSFFVAQGFPVRDHDVMYVSNAPAAELRKFLNILTSTIYSIRSLEVIGNVR